MFSPLDLLFQPQEILIMGDSSRDLAPDQRLERNLLNQGFPGRLIPLNPCRGAVGGVFAYASLEQLQHAPRLAIITGPHCQNPEVLQQLAEKGCRLVMLLDDTSTGLQLDSAWLHTVQTLRQRYNLRIYGPDTLGFALPGQRLNMTLYPGNLPHGSLALLSSSSSIARVLIQQFVQHSMGFACVASIGMASDIQLSDLLNRLASDASTRAILLYLEHLPDCQKFLRAARRAAACKPVVVMMSSNPHDNPSRRAIIEAVLYRAGILRADHLQQMVAMTRLLMASARRSPGERLMIMGNNFSFTRIAANTVIQQRGVLSRLGPRTLQKLPTASRQALGGNPLDIGDDAGYPEYHTALSTLCRDPQVDALLIVHVPTTDELDNAVAQAIIHIQVYGVPTFVCWVGAHAEHSARQLLADAGISSHRDLETATAAIVKTLQHHAIQPLVEQIGQLPYPTPIRHCQAHKLLARLQRLRVVKLPKHLRERLLSLHQLPPLGSRLDRLPPERLSVGIRHPSMVNGAPLLFIDYQINRLAASSHRVYLIPPLNETLAHDGVVRLIRQIHQYSHLPRPLPAQGLGQVLQQLSSFAIQHCQQLHSLTLTMAWQDDQQLLMDKHRLRLKSQSQRVPLLLQPYPAQWQRPLTVGKQQLWLRPIQPQDSQGLQHFVRAMPEQDRRMRFLHPMAELPQSTARLLAQADFDQHMAFVVTASPRQNELLAVVRLQIEEGIGEYAITVSHHLTGQGLGRQLMQIIIDYGRQQQLTAIIGEVLQENTPMLGLTQQLGFTRRPHPEDPALVEVKLTL